MFTYKLVKDMMFRIPPITKNLLIINLIAFLATVVLQLRGVDLADIGGLHFFMANDFHFYQFISYLFLHANFMHILSNMFGAEEIPFLLHFMWNRSWIPTGDSSVGPVLHDYNCSRPKRYIQ